MAEIHVQRKPNNLWWLWVLIILILAAGAYYLYTNNYFEQGNVNVRLLPSAGIGVPQPLSKS
jgi:hypothetical protein